MRSMRLFFSGVAAGLALVAWTPGVRADVQSDQAAAIVVFPKLVVDTSNGVDTIVRLANRSNTPLTVNCFYVNATPRCVNGEGRCITDARFLDEPECTGTCEPQWQETDFRVVLTQNQPVAWLVSRGAVDCPSTPDGIDADPGNNDPCFALDGVFRVGPGGQSNAGSRIPPVPEDPFVGELKCVVVDENDQPLPRNDLYGHASIVEGIQSGTDVLTDVSTYNAIGLRAMPQNDGNRILVLGRDGDPGVEYSGCPNILILDHFFDLATDPVTGEQITTHVTFVPCSQDFLRQEFRRTTVQFLVFNEFEQRFSTSRFVECFRNIQLSNIDTQVNNRSIFSAQVAGTLTGQTRIRGVADDHSDHGHTLLAVAEEFRPSSGAAAVNLHTQGVRPQRDFLVLP
ncbi:MAG: hypothetical protein KatS3mg076_2332 [Candidatus Binatia bacterium]|nr:MAG: hypothetical protein KatS3mg076_2332 [Candidatus Binatia bacterium]